MTRPTTTVLDLAYPVTPAATFDAMQRFVRTLLDESHPSADRTSIKSGITVTGRHILRGGRRAISRYEARHTVPVPPAARHLADRTRWLRE